MSRNDRLVAFTINFEMSGTARWTPCEWHTRSTKFRPADGKPSTENIARYVDVMEKSMQPGGCNAHLAGPMGPDQILSAWVIDQRTGETVAKWTRTESQAA